MRGIAQCTAGQAQGQRLAVFGEVLQGVFEHGQVKPRGPAEAFDPGQEVPGGNGFALRVEQACQYLVMQQLPGVGALHHRLEVQLHLAMGQGVVDPGAPVMLGLVRCSVGPGQVYPWPLRLSLCLGQGLIETQPYIA
ncbi:hypothetical protein D3C78_1372350 [compost metagenome]